MGILHKLKKIIRVNRASRHRMADGLETSLLICTNWNICFRTILNLAAIHRHNGKGMYVIAANPMVFYWYIEVPYVKQNLKYGLPAKASCIYTDSKFWYRLLRKKYDVKMIRYVKNEAELRQHETFPYFIHPEYTWNKPFREHSDGSLHKRIFFAGNQTQSVYAKDNWLQQTFGIPNRINSIDFLKQQFPFREEGQVFVAGLDNGFEMVINNPVGYRLSPQEYEDRLDQCDFFIGLPGMIMPLCHNAMEALVKGKILITPCADWFSPKLEPGVHCLVYQSNEELLQVIQQCISMPEERIAQMKKNVADYLVKLSEREKEVLDHPILIINEDRVSLKGFHPTNH